MKVLIAGIGRSGTSTLFNVLGRAALRLDAGCECWYEPDLWRIPEALKTASIKGAAFSNENIDAFSLYAHKSTPLFADEPTAIYAEWMDQVFGSATATGDKSPSRLVKIIRGMGRLKPILKRFPTLKVILATRNPLDIINSSLGMFSFYGEEFHSSDRGRFQEEMERLGWQPSEWPGGRDIVGWSELWVNAFLRAGLRTAAEFRDRVMVLPHEVYSADKRALLTEVYEFLGFGDLGPEADHLDEPAGPMTTRRNIDDSTAKRLISSLEAYNTILSENGFGSLGESFAQDSYVKFTARRADQARLLPSNLSRTALQWRTEAMEQSRKVAEATHALAAAGGNQAYLNLEGRLYLRQRLSQLKLNELIQPAGVIAGQADVTVGCIITTYNSEHTIAEALASVLAQSRPYSQIVVCDDCSTDCTVERALAILGDIKGATVVRREFNVGPAANRDLGIRRLETLLFTQLDGDDEFTPTKNESELAALRNYNSDIAFSNIELLTEKGRVIQDTSPLDGSDGHAAFAAIATRTVPVPRDMLMSTDLYLSSGGYEYAVSMYEDWSLKLRLCRVMGGMWRHARGDVGTIYNREEAGLSKGSPIRHAYWQLRALGAAAAGGEVDNKILASSCRMILGPLKGKLKGMPDALIQELDLPPERLSLLRELLVQVSRERSICGDEVRLFRVIYGFLNKIVGDVEIHSNQLVS